MIRPKHETDPASLLQKVVKIINTSRAELNGQCGLAVNFDTARSRYSIALGSNPNQILSLKLENLEPAGFMDQAKCKASLMRFQAEQLMTGPEGRMVRNQAEQVWAKISAKLPAFVTPKMFLIGIALVLLSLVYIVGFYKFLVLVSCVSLPVVLLLPDIMRGTSIGLRDVIRLVPLRLREMIKESTGYDVSERVAISAFVIFYSFAVKVLIMSPQTAAKAAVSSAGGGSAVAQSNLDVEAIYKLGWDDAINQLEYGSSLPASSGVRRTPSSDFDEFDYGDAEYIVQPPPKKKGMFGGMGNLLSLFILGKSLIPMCLGPGGRPSLQTFITNLKAMPPWRIGLLAFSIYRLAYMF